MSDYINFPDFIPVGNEKIIANIIQMWQKNKLPHSLIFSGISGIGKASIAKKIAAIIIANQPNNEEINENNVYNFIEKHLIEKDIKQIQASSHTNFLYITADQDTEKRATSIISVDQVRKIDSFLHLKTDNIFPRLIIIDSIDNLTDNASNALLKTLEEPPLNTYFILINHNISKIISTIKSRSRIINFNPIPDEQILDILNKKYNQTLNKEALVLCEGSINKAIWLSNEEGMSAYHYLQSILNTEISWESTMILAAKVRDKKEKIILELLIQMLKNNILNNAKQGVKIHSCINIWESIEKLEYEIENLYLDAGYSVISIIEKYKNLIKA